jgi:GntR family transcriptional regulator, phosphonate transport system regulatory protein
LVNYVIGQRTRFRENLLAQGPTASGENISEEQIAADTRLAKALGIPVGRQVRAICRRGFADDLPISLGPVYSDRGAKGDLGSRGRDLSSVPEVTKAVAPSAR